MTFLTHSFKTIEIFIKKKNVVQLEHVSEIQNVTFYTKCDDLNM